MEGMEAPEYYSSDFFVRMLGSEDIDVKHFMYLVVLVSLVRLVFIVMAQIILSVSRVYLKD